MTNGFQRISQLAKLLGITHIRIDWQIPNLSEVQYICLIFTRKFDLALSTVDKDKLSIQQYYQLESEWCWSILQIRSCSIFKKTIWRESLERCVGLFCLSDYLAHWLRKQTGKTVSSLIHPTEIPKQQFDFDKFKENENKKIIQIGWWLRKLSAIYRLPISKSNRLGYEKIRLLPRFFDDAYNAHT